MAYRFGTEAVAIADFLTESLRLKDASNRAHWESGEDRRFRTAPLIPQMIEDFNEVMFIALVEYEFPRTVDRGYFCTLKMEMKPRGILVPVLESFGLHPLLHFLTGTEVVARPGYVTGQYWGFDSNIATGNRFLYVNPEMRPLLAQALREEFQVDAVKDTFGKPYKPGFYLKIANLLEQEHPEDLKHESLEQIVEHLKQQKARQGTRY